MDGVKAIGIALKESAKYWAQWAAAATKAASNAAKKQESCHVWSARAFWAAVGFLALVALRDAFASCSGSRSQEKGQEGRIV